MTDDLPTLREALVGWVVGGVFEEGVLADEAVYLHAVTMYVLGQSIQRFWQEEDLVFADKRGTEDFNATHRRDASGWYISTTISKESDSELGDARPLALRRFHTLEHKLSLHPDLEKQYQDIKDEYESLGHCKEVDVGKDPAGIIN